MSFARSFRLPASRNAQLVCVAVMLIVASAVISSFHRRPRAWQVDKVPIAFWAWRNESPAEADVREAIENAQARTLFLRAGQIDLQAGKLRRIRPVTGSLPVGIDLHLVYNATRSLLAQLEAVDENALADSISVAFGEDAERAGREQAQVVGLQIDIDMPTRLLGRYGKTLSALRAHLKPDTQLSITGLPTWMDSPELRSTLAQVNFWVPQFYGGEIPQRSDQMVPISSPAEIARLVDKARELDRNFYAGLAAYSCALLYSSSGSLISLRGDMDPTVIASDPNLELIDQRPFEAAAAAGSEWRYAYRARADGVTESMAMHAGDVLVIDVPTTESLRASARIVREMGGEKLQGICVFRLPARDDPATLSAEQVGSALTDGDSVAAFDVRISRKVSLPRTWILDLKNVGTASVLMGSLKIDLFVTPGSVGNVTSKGRASVETRCEDHYPGARQNLQPCGQARANVIRISPPALGPGQTLTAVLVLNHDPPPTIPVAISMQTDAGRPYLISREVITDGGVKR